MNLEKKYRLLFFKYLFDLINLSEYEKYLVDNNVEYITNEIIMCDEEIICSKYSKYFYLLNEIDTSRLNSNEIEFLTKITIDNISDDNVKKFLEDTYKRVLFNDEKDIYYGPMKNEKFKAKSNEIALGFKFDEFGFSKGVLKEEDEIDEKTELVDKTILEIEDKFKEYSIRIIKYNELYEKLNSDNEVLKKI